MSKKAIWIAVAAVLVLGCVVFFPKILSTTMGKRFFIHAVEAKTGGKADVERLHLTWFGPQEASGVELEGSGYQAKVESVKTEIPLWKLGRLKPEKLVGFRGNLSLQGGSFHFQPDVAVEDVNIAFRLHEGAEDFTATGQTVRGQERGAFSLQGHLGLGWNISVTGDVNAFPTLALARFLAVEGLEEILGTSFSLKGFATMQGGKGSCDLSFHSPNADAQIRGNLNENLFTLSDPLRGTVKLTPFLAEKILDGVNPLFVTGVSAEKPIQFRIETTKFRLFLDKPFRWTNLQIGSGMIDVGKIRCSNGSTLGSFIGMLKGSPLVKTKEMDVWFTPLFFKLENGVLQTGRMDALAAKSVRFCTWGNVDLAKDKLDMILGLTAETLKRVFGLKLVTEEYVLKIPITGTIQSPKLAVASGAAKIAALVAAEHVPKGAGGLLNLFLQPESDVPKANRPFPWER